MLIFVAKISMKLLHTSDWHLGKSLKNYNLLQFQEQVLQQILNIIDQTKPDVFIHAGDVYDSTNASKQAINLFSEFIAQCKEKVPHIIVISGNHDNEKIVANYKKILKANNCHFFDAIDETFNQIQIEDMFFYPIPFMSEHDLQETLQLKSDNPYPELFEKILQKHSEKDKVILVLHLGVFASEQQKKWLEDENLEERKQAPTLPADLFKNFYYVALGHFHNYNVLNNNIIYPSSLLKYRSSEIHHKKGVVIVDTSQDKVQHKFIQFDLPVDIMEFFVELDDNNNITKLEPNSIPKNKTIFGVFKVKNLKQNTPIQELISLKLGEGIRFLEISSYETNKLLDEKGFEIETLQELNIENELLNFIDNFLQDKAEEYKNILTEIFNEIKN